MTIKDLYEWAVKNRVEDYELRCAYADGGGYYSGDRGIDDIPEMDHIREEVII